MTSYFFNLDFTTTEIYAFNLEAKRAFFGFTGNFSIHITN